MLGRCMRHRPIGLNNKRTAHKVTNSLAPRMNSANDRFEQENGQERRMPKFVCDKNRQDREHRDPSRETGRQFDYRWRGNRVLTSDGNGKERFSDGATLS